MITSICVLGAFLLTALAGCGSADNRPDASQYVTGKMERRDLVKIISSTGTLAAVVTVSVGSQVSGQIKELFADYNSQVTKGRIIARINPDNYEAKLNQAEAELALAQAQLETKKADVQRAKAEVENAESSLAAAAAAAAKAKAAYTNAQRTFARKKALVDKEYVSKTDYDSALTGLEEAKAEHQQALANERAAQSQVRSKKASQAMAEAEISEVTATIRLKQAALQTCKVDLEHTIIRSPVNGVVIDRKVDVGQTVAASLEAPTLFTIAQDLSKMEVSASVDEADIGRIKEGQQAYFMVDAYGAHKFTGQVKQVRKAATTTSNVVTYAVIISAANDDLSLMPGMTADVQIVVAEKRDVLAVPNGALRFKPNADAAEKSEVINSAQASGAQFNTQLERLATELKLSEQQKAKIKEGLDKQLEAMNENGQTSLFGGPPRRRNESSMLRKQFQAKVMAVLNQEQQERYKLIMSGRLSLAENTGTLWVMDSGPKPRPLTVSTGLSDGNYTQVQGPDLKQGMTIITGTR